jgi:hypothetical protein
MSTSVVSFVRLLLSTRGRDDYFKIAQASVHVKSSCNLLLVLTASSRKPVSFSFDTCTVELAQIQVLAESLPSTHDSTNDLDSKLIRFFLDTLIQDNIMIAYVFGTLI